MTAANEVEQLRAEVAAYKQREFDSIRDRLIAALADIASWQAECRRISAAAMELDSARVDEIATLKGQLAAARERR